MSEVRKCPSCGWQNCQKKRVKPPADASFPWFRALCAAAYVCSNCGYIEFYRDKEGVES